MILTCDACKTRYMVNAEDIGVGGRDVKCAVCGLEWFEAYRPDPVDPEPVAAPEPAQSWAQDWEDDEFTLDDEAPGAEGAADDDLVLPSVASPLDDDDYTSRLPMVRPAPEPGMGLVAIVVAALLVLGFGLFVIEGRQAIVTWWPPAAHAYALFGLDVELEGLAMRDVRAERMVRADGTSPLKISGALVNTSPFAQSVPPLKLTVRDANSQLLFFTTIDDMPPVLETGESVGFMRVLWDVPADAHGIEVDFTVAPQVQ